MGVPYQDKSNIDRWAREGREPVDLRCRGNTWFIPYETITRRSGKSPASCDLPLEASRDVHQAARSRQVQPGDADPFSGLGNTTVACARLGIPFIGYEIDEGSTSAESIERVAQALDESAKDSAGDAQMPDN